MSKGRIVAIVCVVLVLALMIGLLVAGMTRGAAWVFGVENMSYDPDYSGDGSHTVSVGLPGIKVDVGDDNVRVNVGGIDVDVDVEDSEVMGRILDRFSNGGDWMFGFGSGHSWGSTFDGTVVDGGRLSLDANSVRGLKVNWIGGRMDIEFHDSPEVLVVQSCSTSIPEDRKLVYRVDRDGTLVMREGQGRRITSRTHTDLKVYLPENLKYLETLDLSGVSTDISAKSIQVGSDIEVSVVSGIVYLEGMETTKKIDIDSTSGDVNLKRCSAGEMGISTTSGNVELGEVEVSGELEMDTVSGDMRGSGVTAEALETDAVSGEAYFDNSNFGKIECSSVSGEISVQNRDTPKKLNMNTTSGDVEMTVFGEASGFTANYSTVSGGFRCDFPTTSKGKHEVVYGDGTADFDFSTVSGDIAIIKG